MPLILLLTPLTAVHALQKDCSAGELDISHKGEKKMKMDRVWHCDAIHCATLQKWRAGARKRMKLRKEV